MQKFAIFGAFTALLALLTVTAPAQDADEVVRLRRENELLKKENELLKKEIELLKREATIRPGAEKPGGVKVTLNNVEYEFVSLKMDGTRGLMRIAATSKKGQQAIHGRGLRLVTADGVEHEVRIALFAGNQPMQTLQEGVRVVVEYQLGDIPTEFKEFATIILPNNTGNGFAQDARNPVILKGKFAVEGR